MIHWLSEENYDSEMNTQVLPYLEDRKQTGYFERIPGDKIYYEHYHADEPKGVIVISHGFTESIRKYYESIYYMLQEGYSVWGEDHRGHGNSLRSNENPYVVHIRKFQDYVLDLKYLSEELVKPAAGDLPLFLYCHSMGGCIGAWLIEAKPDLFRRAVLSSPMLGLTFGKVPTPVAYVGAQIKSRRSGKAEPLTPIHHFPKADFANSCDSSECRYLYYNRIRQQDVNLQGTSASVGWGMEAVKACSRVTSRRQSSRIKIPVLLFQAGNDTVVDNRAQQMFASRVKTCKLERIPDMKHELYMTDSDVLIPYWKKIFKFFAGQ